MPRAQAFIEGLRYYPQGQAALDGNDCQATYSGNTHHKNVAVFEHLETDLRSRLDIAPGEWIGPTHEGSLCADFPVTIA